MMRNVARCAQSASSVFKYPSRLAGLGPTRLFSSDSDDPASVQSPPQTSSAPSPKKTGFPDVEDVSNEDLKQRIENFMKGDLEAIPSIFDAILKRKLSGKHEDWEDEAVLNEIQPPQVNGNEEEDTDGDDGDDVRSEPDVKEDSESDISDCDK